MFIEQLLCARHCAKCVIHSNLLIFTTTTRVAYSYCSCVTGGEKLNQRNVKQQAPIMEKNLIIYIIYT